VKREVANSTRFGRRLLIHIPTGATGAVASAPGTKREPRATAEPDQGGDAISVPWRLANRRVLHADMQLWVQVAVEGSPWHQMAAAEFTRGIAREVELTQIASRAARAGTLVIGCGHRSGAARRKSGIRRPASQLSGLRLSPSTRANSWGGSSWSSSAQPVRPTQAERGSEPFVHGGVQLGTGRHFGTVVGDARRARNVRMLSA